MKIIRLIRFGIVALIVLFVVMTLLSLLFPSSLRVEREVSIAASKQRTLATVTDLRTWTQWNEFVSSPQITHKEWSNFTSGAGAWIHSDQLTVIESGYDTSSGVVELSWGLKGGKTYSGGLSVVQTFPDSVTVQYWFDLHFRWYPWEKLGVFVYDRKLGPAMEESLGALKRYVENTR